MRMALAGVETLCSWDGVAKNVSQTAGIKKLQTS